MPDRNDLLSVFCEVVNGLKKTGFTPDIVEEGWYLGGDLGIDSMEMLEIWFDMEKKLGLKIDDTQKRDVYTIKDVLSSIEDIMAECA